jgi:hypothetical protein
MLKTWKHLLQHHSLHLLLNEVLAAVALPKGLLRHADILRRRRQAQIPRAQKLLAA